MKCYINNIIINLMKKISVIDKLNDIIINLVNITN